MIDLIGFLLKLLYFVQSSRKKQCTNLNTLRPKNSYTFFLSSPVSRATKFCCCYCFNKGKLHKPASCPGNGSSYLIAGWPGLICCYSASEYKPGHLGSSQGDGSRITGVNPGKILVYLFYFLIINPPFKLGTTKAYSSKVTYFLALGD